MSDDTVIPLPSGISQRQVAEAIGISVSTVSRALAGHPQVSARTRSDVLRAIEELQGKPGGEATGYRMPVLVLSRGHSGGTADTLSEFILEQVLGGAETVALAAGYRIYVVNDALLLRQDVNASIHLDLHGVMLAGGVVSSEVLDSVQEYSAPVVLIGGHLPDRHIPSVASDSLTGMRSVAAHLIGLGHRRIGLVNGPTDTYTSIEKKAGYLTALAEAGIAADLELIRWQDRGVAGFNVENAAAMTRDLLSLPVRPTALVFATDEMALAGMAACRAQGLAIPTDISIAGFHDDPAAQLAVPTLTTVHVDRFEWGAAAVRRLLRVVDEPPASGDRLLLPTRLVVRESTAPPLR